MTDILTRMLFTSNRTRAALSASHSSSESSPLASSHSEDGDVEATADANSDETGKIKKLLKVLLHFRVP